MMLLWFSSMASSLSAARVKFPREPLERAQDQSQGCIPTLETYSLRRAGRPPIAKRLLERQCQRRAGSFDARTRDRQATSGARAASTVHTPLPEPHRAASHGAAPAKQP